MKWTLKLIVAALSLGTALSRAEDASFAAATTEIVTTAKKQAPDLSAEKACLEKIIDALAAKDLETNEVARKEPQHNLDLLEFVVSRPGAEKEREAFCAIISEKLGGALHTPAKVWLLKSLERIGKAESVSAEIKLLADADPLVSETARRALAANPADAAATDLRKAIEAAADPKARAALIEALGYKLNKADVALFVTNLQNPDAGVHAAAVGALASQHIRTETGVMDQAAELVDMSGREGNGVNIPKIIAALSSENVKLRQAAIQGATFNTSPEMTTAMIGALKTANPDVKPALIAVISQRADKAAIPVLLEEIKNPDPLVRTAVISGIANFSDSSAYQPLLALVSAGGEDQRVARECLDRIKSPEIDNMLAQAAEGDPVQTMRIEALQRLAARNATSKAAAILPILAISNAEVRTEAIKTLGAIGNKDSLEPILSIVNKGTDAEREAAAKAIIAISKRLPETDGHVELVAKAAHDAPAPARIALITALGQIGGPKALEAVHETLKDSNEALHEAAFRSLANWADAAPMNEMLEQTKNAKDETHRVLALRAFVRMAALPGTHTGKETLAFIMGAQDAIKTPDDRKLILNALSDVKEFGAVEASAKFITDPTVSEEACIATIKGSKRYDNNQHNEPIAAMMKDVLAHAKNKSTKDQAQAVLDKVSKK